MTHSTDHTLLLLLGQFVGVLGVGIAVYLQVIVPRRCDARYFWGFLVFGSGMVIAHIGWVPLPYLGWLPVIGYFLLIGLQIYAANWVYRNSELPGMKESFETAFKTQ